MLHTNIENFSSELFKRGHPYIRKISYIEDERDLAIFTVHGSEAYKVTLQNMNGEALFARCTCPAFQERDECKHVAACIMKAEDMEFGENFQQRNKIVYIGSSRSYDKELIDFYNPKRPVVNQLERIMKFVEPVEVIDDKEIFPKEEVQKGPGELWYEIQISSMAWSSTKITLAFKIRAILKNGSRGKIKEHRLKLSELEALGDFQDQQIVKQLLPLMNAYPLVRDEVSFDSAYLRAKDAQLLDKIISTGRCYLRRSFHDGENSGPLKLIKGDPLEVKIRTNMIEQWMDVVILDGETVVKKGNLDFLSIAWDFRKIIINENVYSFESFVGRELYNHIIEQKRISFQGLDIGPYRDELLSKMDHRAFTKDYFGLTPKLQEVESEVHVQLPLQSDVVSARLISKIAKQTPPFTHILIPDTSKLNTLKENLRVDQDGFFEIPINDFHATVAMFTDQGITVKAEKVIVKSATGFSMSMNHAVNWFEIKGEMQVDQKMLDLPVILKALKEGTPFLEFKKGEYTYMPEAWLEKIRKVQDVANFENGKFVVHSSRALQLENLKIESQDFRDFLHKIKEFQKVELINASEKFKGSLRDYQCFGISWMKFLRDLKLGGCLADDMGLGKTVQVAATLQLRLEDKSRKSKISLVVCPRSLVFNWNNELQRFAPNIRIKIHDGGTILTDLKDCDVLITTYGLMQRNAEKLNDIEFDYIVLDEAQAIKNARSLTSKAAFTLKAHHRLALTGTPIENHIGEFYSIFNFLMPGAFKKEAMNPSLENLNLARALRPFMLRRTKDQVLKDLPDKIEQVIFCVQEEEERKHYLELKEFASKNINKEIETEGLKKSVFMFLEALTRLRQAACHPGLVNKELTHLPSGKILQLQEMLEEITQEGHKVVVFSQFTTLLKLVRNKLGMNDENSVYLDGSTKDREKVVGEFKSAENKNVFFVSIKAGGTGLNLTEASYCFLLDPWWNPAVEEQAIARLHRIGQKKSVNVYRLITKGSIEEKVMDLQKAKKTVVEDILEDDSEGFIRSMSAQDLEYILS